ncbi:glycosyltransferase [Methylobacterium sp. 77]|uniref:glycosyltransferase family 32 protein n=1 Tax=Methylobacterium sp. 77 TaxID=1101192 RepID=UPI0012DCB442|nr:glycosyltransferase [Methylobacterium sp. 77]
MAPAPETRPFSRAPPNAVGVHAGEKRRVIQAGGQVASLDRGKFASDRLAPSIIVRERARSHSQNLVIATRGGTQAPKLCGFLYSRGRKILVRKNSVSAEKAMKAPDAETLHEYNSDFSLPKFANRRHLSNLILSFIDNNKLDQARSAIDVLSSMPSKDETLTFAGMNTKEQTLRRLLAKKAGNKFEAIGLAENQTPNPEALKVSTASLEDLKLSSEHGRREIPKIIHQVWIGTKPCPVGSPDYWRKWCAKYGYEYHLWTQEEVEKLRCYESPAYTIYLKRKLYAGVVDVIRAEILHDIGGLYVDMDMFPVDVGASYHELLSMNGLVGLPAGHYRQLGLGALFLTNNVMGSTAQHPVMRRYIEGMTPSAAALPDAPAWWTVGGCLLTAALLSTTNVISRAHMATSSRIYDMDIIDQRIKQLESGNKLKLFYSVKFW